MPNPVHLVLALALCVISGGLVVVSWGPVGMEF